MSRILIVDDRATNRTVLSKLARAAEDGAEVHAFADPREALHWVQENTPDLVVTDYKMPGMDGAEFTRLMRSQPFCYDVPIVVVTIYSDRSFRYRALNAGATDFLLSPVDHQEFQARVRNLLKLRGQQKVVQRRTQTLERRLLASDELHRAALRESEKVLHQVINALPAFIHATGRDGRIVFANSRTNFLWPAGTGDVVGRTVAEVFGADYARRSETVDNQMLAGIQSQTEYEEEFIGPEGGRRVLLTSKVPLRDAAGRVTNVVTTSLDITDRKTIERTVARQKDHLQVIIDSIPNFVSVTDEHGRFVLANRALAQALGTAPDAMTGAAYGAVVRDGAEVARFERERVEVLHSGKPKFVPEHAIVGTDGRQYWLQTIHVPFISASDGAAELLSVSTDIGARREAEMALRTARDAADASNVAKTHFLANMSHELRTPLNAISGFAELIAAETLGPVGVDRYGEYARDIADSAAHLRNLINDILDVANIERGELNLSETTVDLAAAVRTVAGWFAKPAGDKNLELSVRVGNDLPHIRADADRIRQILSNLVSNAVKFTPDGGRIELSAGCSGDGGILLAVSDTGSGMAADTIATATSRFGKSERNALTAGHPGMGLGLPLAMMLMELHAGRLDLTSAPGAGTTATLHFPAARIVPRAAA